MDLRKGPKSNIIVFLLTHTPDPRIVKRINALSEISDDLTVIYWNRFKELFKNDLKNVKSIIISLKSSRSLFLRIIIGVIVVFKSFILLLKVKPTLIYIDGIDFFFPALIYKKIFYKKTKIVLEIADIPGYYRYKNIVRDMLEKTINNVIINSDLFIFTSPFFREDYYKEAIKDDSKVLIIENVPEKRIFTNFQKKEIHGVFTIGYIGSIRYIQQLKLLLEACKDLEGINIFIAGGSISEDLGLLIDKYKNVKYVGPYNYERDILELYSVVDLIYAVYDTDSENVRVALPNKLYEAIVCGIPIVVAKGTRLAEYVERLGVGFAVSDKDPIDLRDLILKLKLNRAIIKAIEERDERIKENYYWENVKEIFVRKISDLIWDEK